MSKWISVLLLALTVIGAAEEPEERASPVYSDVLITLAEQLHSGNTDDVMLQLGFDKALRIAGLNRDLLLALEPGAPDDHAREYKSGCYLYLGTAEDSCLAHYAAGDLLAWLYCSGKWLAAATGFTEREIKWEFQNLYNNHTSRELTVEETGRWDDCHVFETRPHGVRLKMYEEPGGRISFLCELPYKRLLVLDKENKSGLQPLIENLGKQNQPLSLAGLIELIDRERAIGLMAHYDFSGFTITEDYSWPTIYRDADYSRVLRLTTSPDGRFSESECCMEALDNGSRTYISFSGEWYDQANPQFADELYDEFTALHADNDGKSVRIPGYGEYYDMEFSCFRSNDLLVSRKQFFIPDEPDILHYAISTPGFESWFSINGDIGDPVWPDPDIALLDLSEDSSDIEKIIHLIAQTNLDEIADSMYLEPAEQVFKHDWTYLQRPFCQQYRRATKWTGVDSPSFAYTAYDMLYPKNFVVSFSWLAEYVDSDTDTMIAEFEVLMERLGGETIPQKTYATGDFGQYHMPDHMTYNCYLLQFEYGDFLLKRYIWVPPDPKPPTFLIECPLWF